MTFREFTGKNVEEAIRAAMAEFSSDLSELDIEILAQGNRGVLGVGAEEARILAAPKSEVAAAETVRAEPRREQMREAPVEEAPEPVAEAVTDVTVETPSQQTEFTEPTGPIESPPTSAVRPARRRSATLSRSTSGG